MQLLFIDVIHAICWACARILYSVRENLQLLIYLAKACGVTVIQWPLSSLVHVQSLSGPIVDIQIYSGCYTVWTALFDSQIQLRADKPRAEVHSKWLLTNQQLCWRLYYISTLH